jgi:hypothetical protein
MRSNLLGYSPSLLPDPVLLGKLSEVAARDRALTAELLLLIAEAGGRRLYREQGFESMYEYCVVEQRMSRDVACRRIRAAQAARRHPAILPALVEGRLGVSAVAPLSPHLDTPLAKLLLVEAEGCSRREIDALIARHFPRPDAPTLVEPVAPPASAPVVAAASFSLAPAALRPAAEAGTVEFEAANVEASSCEVALAPLGRAVPAGEAKSMVPEWPRTTELSPGRFRYQFMLSQEAHEKLEYAKALLARRAFGCASGRDRTRAGGADREAGARQVG